MQDGLMRQHSHSSPDSLELNLHSTTVAVALLSLHTWLAELCGRGADLPARVSIIAGKGKAKDAGHSIIKETVTALLRRCGLTLRVSEALHSCARVLPHAARYCLPFRPCLPANAS
jgi:DNA-nicking Smr family endonuclease